VPAGLRRPVKTRAWRGRVVAFTNAQHRRRYAEDAKHRERKLAASRVYGAEHRDRLNAARRDKWQSDAEFRARHTSAQLVRNYGLTREQHRRLVEAQNGVCAICKQSSRRALCVDHCHATRQVRGLLCDKCNTALGLFDDDARRMLAAVAYLDRVRVIPEALTAGLSELLAGLLAAAPGASSRPPPKTLDRETPDRRRVAQPPH
jgi:Recombination endonuclease VII